MIFHVFFGRKKHVIYGPFSLSVKVEVDKIRSWHFIFMCFSFPHWIWDTHFLWLKTFRNGWKYWVSAGILTSSQCQFWMVFAKFSAKIIRDPVRWVNVFSFSLPTEPLCRPKRGCGNFSLPTAENELMPMLSRHFPSRVACLKNEQQEHFGLGALFYHWRYYPTPTHPTQRSSNIAPILNASYIEVITPPTQANPSPWVIYARGSRLGIYVFIIVYIYCPAFMIVEKVVLYICIFGHHGYSTNIHYWSELGTLRTS